MQRTLSCVVAGLLIPVMTAVPTGADERRDSLAISTEDVNRVAFAVDSKVYVDSEEQPIVSTTTIFYQNHVYDRATEPMDTITCFDFERQVVMLVDRTKGTRTSIAFTDLLRFQAELRARAMQREGLAAFLADPTFIREFDASKSTIKLSSPWITYEAAGIQSPSEIVELFVEFADWSSRLASMVNPAAPPAQARLELNKALKKQNWQVTRVTRTGGPRAVSLGVVRSEHTYREEISESDRHLIEAVEKDLKEFKEISFSEYRALRNSHRVVTKK